MHTPDFAMLGPPMFEAQDLRFLFERFPVPGVNMEEAVQLALERPTTLESLLDSDYVAEAIDDRQTQWLEVSPKLFFNVLLRRSLPGPRNLQTRRTIHYLANLLGLFVSSDRLYRVQNDEEQSFQYLVDLVQEAAQSGPERCFVVQSHIGNYSLFLAGLCKPWIDYRHQYKRRPVSMEYYCRMGSGHFFTASRHRLAEQTGVKPVFQDLAMRFDYYRGGLERMSARWH